MKLLEKTTLFNYLLKVGGGKLDYNAYMLRSVKHDAVVYVLEKEEKEKTFTEKRIKTVTGINDLSNYTIYTKYLSDLTLSYINRHAYINVLLLENKFTTRKYNSCYNTLKRERETVAQHFYDKKYNLKKQLQEQREEAKRLQAQEHAKELKSILSLKIVNLIKTEALSSKLDALNIKKYASYLDKLNSINYLSQERFDFLKANNFESDKIITVKCSSQNKYNSNIKFNVVINQTILDLLFKGVYSYFLNEFETQTGQIWINNTSDFTCDLEILHHGI